MHNFPIDLLFFDVFDEQIKNVSRESTEWRLCIYKGGCKMNMLMYVKSNIL